MWLKKKLPKIEDHLPDPDLMVQAFFHCVGKMRDGTNDIWIGGPGGGTTVPLSEFEKALEYLFNRFSHPPIQLGKWHFPDVFVKAYSYKIGRKRYEKGEFHKNDYWIENKRGKEVFVPQPFFEKALLDLFNKYM